MLAVLLLSSILASAPRRTVARPVTAYLWEKFTIANNSSKPYPPGELVVAIPLNDSYQRSYLVNFSLYLNDVKIENYTTRLVREECGSVYMVFEYDGLVPPYGTLSMEIVTKVVVERFKTPDLDYNASGTLDEIPVSLIAEYTRSEGPWKYGEPCMSYLAEEARRLASGEKNVLRVVARLVEWIWSKIEYEVGVGPRYPNETLPLEKLQEGRGKGDCDDQANLLILMLRSLGIPSYLKVAFVGDFNYGEERERWEPESHYYVRFMGINWGHAWAEVYVPPWGWLPVDLTFHKASDDPLESIASSATSEYWAWYTIVTVRVSNVCHLDYVRSFREEIASLSESPLYYYEEYMIVGEGDSIGRLRRFMEPLPLPWIKEASLSLTAPPKVKVFEEFEVKGRLEPGVADAPITLTLVDPDGNTTSREIRTSSDGSWSIRLKLNRTGLWHINASYPGSSRYTPAKTSRPVLVEKLESRLEVHAESRDSAIVVWGSLYPPLETNISIVVEAPNGTRLAINSPAIRGLYNATFSVEEPGVYQILVSWLGNEYYRHVLSNVSLVVKSSVKVLIEEVPEEIPEGEKLEVRGRLKPPISGAEISITAVSSGGDRVSSQTSTSSDGTFRAELELKAGYWNVTVMFSGGENYYSASNSFTIRVVRPRLTASRLVLAAAVAVALITVAVWILKRRRVSS